MEVSALFSHVLPHAACQSIEFRFTMWMATSRGRCVSFHRQPCDPQCSITAVEASAPQVGGSLPSLDEFTAPVHQEQRLVERIPDDCALQPGACEPPCKKQCTGIQVQQIAAQYAEIDAGARAIDHSLLNKPGLAILVQACGAGSSIPDWTHCDAPGKKSTMGACVAH